MEKVSKKEFIELDYTGKLANNIVFDTTIEATAKEHNIYNEHGKYKPTIICVGERQVVPGLDEALPGKELNKIYTISVTPENAFGKKDAKNIRLVPMRTFQKENIMPQPGLRVNIDGDVATVLRVSGGRILVDFNHPLAGKEVIYDITIKRKVADKKEQIESYLKHFPIPMTVSVKEDKATVTSPQELPKPITDELSKKLKEVIGTTVEFQKEEKKEKKGKVSSEKPTTRE